MTEELSVNDILHDPLIRQLLRADRISFPNFAVFLQDAIRRQAAEPARPASAPRPLDQRPLESRPLESRAPQPLSPSTRHHPIPTPRTRCLEQATS